MKVKNSRGIAMKLICCTALVVLTSVLTFSQTPKSGALLSIDGTAGSTAVHLKIYDSQIHTATVRSPAGNNTCSAVGGSDDIPTDAYVLQGGAPTGCDPGDAFETSPSQQLGSATLGNFTITTKYPLVGNDQAEVCESTGNTSHVCIGGANPSVDTGFLTVKNNGADFNGTITLAGKSGPDGGLCSPGNTAITDSFTGPLAAGDSRTFALAQDSSNCGGFNQPQLLTLSQNATSTAFFGKDDYQIKPLNPGTSPISTLSVLPVPVPAGPLVSGNFGSESVVASALRFSAGANFSSTTSCVPYADFSAPGNPVCVELQLTPNDTGNYLYTAQNDYNIDANSLAGGIGGPKFLGHHTVNCPDSGFDINIFTSYTAPSATFGDPLKGSGGGTGSCWVVAFDPNAPAIPTGTTFSAFTGFQSPVSDTDLNLVKAGSGVPLIWTYFSSPGVPITNLSLCPGPTVPTGSSCPVSGVQQPWVFVGTIMTACMVDSTPNTATDTTVAAGSSSLQNFFNGTYQYNLKTVKGMTGCFDAVLIFDTGLTVFPANFKYTK